MNAISKLTALSVLIPLLSFSQGEIRGNVHTITAGESVPFAVVSALQDTIILTTTTDLDGNFVLKPLPPGNYSLRANCIGFQPGLLKNILVSESKVTFVNIVLQNGVELKEVEVRTNEVQKTITYEEINAVPLLDVNSVSSKSAGVFHRNRQKEQNVRGSRADGTAYYVDGIKVHGHANPLPENNDEEYALIHENQFQDVLHNPLSTLSIDVDEASYSNIRRFIMQGTLPPKDAVRIEEMINYFRYHYPQPEEGYPFSISTEVSKCPWNKGHLLASIGLNGKAIATENLPDNNFVFLIDVSGSMDEPNKLPLVKKSLHLLVEQLRAKDRVAIVVYAGNAGLVLSSTKGSEKEKILSSIDNLQAGGSTAGGAGIELAYKIAAENFLEKGNNRVILATDGDFNVGISDADALETFIEKKRGQGIFLTVLGFGTGNYKDAKMERLADKGNGNLAYVDNIMEANKVLVKEMGATLYTIAKDVKLQIEFNPAIVKAYKLIGYENRMLENRDFNDDKKDAGELGAGSSVTALYELVPAGSNENFNLVDSLRYQQPATVPLPGKNELLTVKFRYKEPQGLVSKLIVHPLEYQADSAAASDDFRFAAAVASFGLLLKDSESKGSADYKSIIESAKASKGNDEEGYRAEFIRLVELAEVLNKEAGRLAGSDK
jgi:Ca-activated chloride channel family protein